MAFPRRFVASQILNWSIWDLKGDKSEYVLLIILNTVICLLKQLISIFIGTFYFKLNFILTL